jgi:dephospho-CoA kinase
LIIGFAGYSGSGKSSIATEVSNLFNAKYYDVDRFAKDVMSNNQTILDRLSKEFGVVKGSKIDYKSLGEQVFNSDEKLNLLNSIVHPTLVDELNISFQKCQSQTIVVDAALLSLWENRLRFDFAFWIDAKRDLRLDRVAERTGYSREMVDEMFCRQERLFLPPAIDGKRWFLTDNSRDLQSSIEYVKSVIDKKL